MPDPWADERVRLIRATRQRLESLRRAGLDWLPIPALPAAIDRPARVVRVEVVTASPPKPTIPSVTPMAAAIPKPAPIVPPRGPSTAAPSLLPAGSAPLLLPGSLFEESSIGGVDLPPAGRIEALRALAAEVAVCQRCPILASTRTQTVFGVGDPSARLMFVGEAPGADEDRTGEPFVGRSGALLTDMITKGMGLGRDQVYIANILKSRPPENRNPTPEEVSNCLPFLERQMEIVRPEFLCLLGKTAASTLLQTALPMTRLRGKWHRYRGIPTIVTFHPSYLLRSPEHKRDAWEDLKMLMQAMGIQAPARK
ncbi:uracil-DNA glycosylase [Isosphaeraceae bacterium EP7]